jgi:myo-inositol-1(or 4)-monophosphatase
MTPDLTALLPQVVTLVKSVGRFIRTEAENFDRTRMESKHGFNNLVSYVDKEAEQKLVDELKKLLPQAGFLAEEGTTPVAHSGYRWIIDPLDGTTNFMHNLPPYAVSVALADGDRLLLGVVYEIGRDECFHALLHHGAFCNNRSIKVSPINRLSESLLATGFPYSQPDKQDAYLDIIKKFLDNTHGIRRFGSASVDLAYVACGRIEGFFEYNLNAWDVAAGALIVMEAGGTVTDFSGKENYLHGGELIAAGPVHASMQKIIYADWFS